MPKIDVFNLKHEKVGELDLSDEVFAAEVKEHLLHEVVTAQLASRRSGTRAGKERSAVRGTSAKLYRQKGTGNARAGSKRSPIRRGGGHSFALATRDVSHHLPRKAVRAATRMAVASKIKDDQLVVIDELKLEQPQTKDVASILKALKIDGMSTIIATAGHDTIVYKSARNIARVTVSSIADLNALAVLKPQRMLITQAALQAFQDQAVPPRSKSQV
jgi:large subunit ribosomal protein L4